MALCSVYTNAQDIGVSKIVLVEGALNAGASSVTYDLCPTNPISLQIILENFGATSDTVSKVTLSITGVNPLARQEFTISNTVTIPVGSVVTITYPDDFSGGPPNLSFVNPGLSTITVSTTSVSGTGDLNTDNDAFYIVGKVFTTVTPTLSSPQNGIACQGEEISFSISPSTGTEYKFYVNGALAYQGSNTLITFSSDPTDVDALSDGDVITIAYTDANGCIVDSNTISKTVTIYSLPTAGLSSGIAPETICEGDFVTFTASGGTEYAFYKAGILVQARSASNTYTTNGLSNTQSVTVIAYNANGCEDQETIEMDVLSISSAGSITFSIPSDANVCYGIAPSGTLSSTSAAVVSHDLSYQWQSSFNGLDWSNINGATDLNYTPPKLFQTTYFKRVASVASNTLICSDGGDSNILTITVDAAFPLNITTNKPLYCIDEVIQFSAAAGAVSYTFLINGISAQVSSTENFYATVSTTTSSLTVKNNDIVTVIAQDANGCTVSDTITVVSSNTPLNPSLSTDIPGNILCYGDTVAITATGGSSYVFSINGLAPLEGEVSGNVFTTSRLTDGAEVEVSVTNAIGCSKTISITFEVISLVSAGTVTITNPSELSVCYDTAMTATLSSTAPATSSDSIHYQWQSSTDGSNYVNLAGKNDQNLDLSSLPNFTTTTYFKRRAIAYIDSNSNGVFDIGESNCNNGIEALPIRIEVDDSRTPTITSSTGSFAFCMDTPVTFEAIGAVIGDTYTWEIVSGATTSTSTGSITAAATTTDTTIDNTGLVKLTITTSAGCSYEVTESITVVAAPAATVSASATTVCENGTVTLTASPAGQATYTFYNGGQVLQSSGSRTYVHTGLVTTTTFRVEVENATGCTGSTSITISVPKLASAGTISITTEDQVLCSGEILTSSIDGDGTSGGTSATLVGTVGTIQYQWQISYDNGNSYSDLVLATGADLTPAQLGTISQTVNVQRLAYVLNGGVVCASEASNPIQINLEDERFPDIRFNGISINTIDICPAEVVRLTGQGALAGDTYIWSINGTVQVSNTTNYNIPSGTLVGGEVITLGIETAEGCVFEKDISVTAIPEPVIQLSSNALTPHVICENDSVTFTVTNVPSATYYWSKYSTTTPTLIALGGSPTQTNSITVSGLTLSDGDIISVTVSYTAACSVTDSITINVVELNPGAIDSTPPVLEVCSSDIPNTITSIALASSTNGTVSITYDWEYSVNGGVNWISTGVDSVSFAFGGTLPETRLYRRVAIASWSGIELCRAPSLTDLEIRVRDPEGGTFPVTTQTVCYSFGAKAAEITVTGAATGTYQWQQSVNGGAFTDIPGANNAIYQPTITSTQTIQFRRITFSTATCSDTTDNIYTLRVSDLDPGSLSTSPTAIYCYGTQPPMLGIENSVDATSSLGPVTYIWKYKIEGTAGPFNIIPGANARNYQPPPLSASPSNTVTSYLYQRVAVDASGCQSEPTNTVTITITPFIDPGDLGFRNVAPLNYYICEGQENPDDLVLRNATPPSSGVVTYTWQQSTDEINWTTVPSSTSNAQLSFGTSNTPTETTYYRVKISSGNATPSAVSSTLTVALIPSGSAISYGEIYNFYLAGNHVQVITSSTISTTDTIGADLANKITTTIPGYNATYFPDQDVIVIDNYTDNVSVYRATNGVSSTLFMEIIPIHRDASESVCTSYSNSIRVIVYEAPKIIQKDAPFDSQIICVGDAIDPVSFEVSGSYDYVEVTGIASPAFNIDVVAPGTATYSATTNSWFIANTNLFTISGTPTLALDESLNIRMITAGACRDEAEFNYRIETVNGPDTPDIIYRNVAQQRRGLDQRYKIFNYDGTWFNNTVCQDEIGIPPNPPDVTYEFAACYSNSSSLRDVKFDWEVYPPSAISSLTFKNSVNNFMSADIKVNNITGTSTFTANQVFTITITGPNGVTDTETYNTAAVQFDILVDQLEARFDLLNYVRVDQADRDGDGTNETLVFIANTAGEAGYFSLSIQNPNNAEFLLESPQYQYPLKNSAIQVIFNPDFGTTSSTTGGVTATLRVRAESVECTGVYSDWYEVELFIVSEKNPVSTLPTLREPIAFNSIEVCGGNAYNAIPTCELTSTQGWDTIFYSAPTATSSYTYAHLEWKIDNIVALSPNVDYPGRYNQWNGGIDPEYGVISWNPGFYGQFNVCVRPIACDASTDSDGDGFDDELGWVCRTITINPLKELPNIFPTGLPLCPIPATGTVTSTFTSDLNVDWSIQPAIAVSSTSIISVDGKDALQVVWRNGFAGTAWISAETTSCSSGVRNFTVRIPDEPELTRTSSLTFETVCQGEPITPITFSVNGYSVIGIDDSELPAGLTATYTANVQSATFNINRRNGQVDPNALTYIISIDYQDYTLTVSNSATINQITSELSNLIASTPLVGSVTSTVYTTTSTIEIIGLDPGVRFNIATNAPRLGQFSLSQPAISIQTGEVVVSGNISETLTVSSTGYLGTVGGIMEFQFNLRPISLSASCTTNDVGEVRINYSPNHIISTATPTLLTQYLCDGEALDEIIFDLSGGARDYEPPVWFPSQPNGVVFDPSTGNVLGAGTSFSLTGTLNTGVTTTTVYYYTITTTGTLCDTDTIMGSIVVYPNNTVDRLDPQQGLNPTQCNGTDVNFIYDFEGIPGLTITSTNTLANLGLVGVNTYTNTPSVELTVVASATSVGEVFQVEIVEEDGSVRSHRFTSLTGTESATKIAQELAAAIDVDPEVSATSSGTVITVTANDLFYVFWIRINRSNISGSIEHINNARIQVTNAVPVKGFYTVSGTISVDISTTTSYSLVITTSSERCDAVSSTTVLTVEPSQIITATDTTTLAQEFCDGAAVNSPTFVLDGGATGYSVVWSPSRPTGIDFDAAPGINIGTQTFTLTGNLNTGDKTTKVYYYTITTESLSSCNTDTVTGTIVVHPNNSVDRLDPQELATVTIEDESFLQLSYEFEGIPDLTVTSTNTLSTLGLTVNKTYTATPSVELTLIASASFVGEIFQVELVEEAGGSRSYRYRSITGTESATKIAQELALAINGDPKVSATSSGTVITIIPNTLDYVFWVRINRNGIGGTIEHYNNSKIRVTNTVATQGVLTVTGTPTLGNTSTESYTLEIQTVSDRCDLVSATTVIIIEPTEIIIPINPPNLIFEFKDGTTVNSPTFVLAGGATDYSVNWSNGSPPNLNFSPNPGAVNGTSTITLSGNLNSGITTTTVYYFTITSVGTSNKSDTVTGTIVIHPNDPNLLLNPLQGDSQIYCDNSFVELNYAFSGIPELTLTTTSTLNTLGLTSSITYTTTPSVELTIVQSATQPNEYFQIEIVEENGGSRTHSYRAPSGTESAVVIAEALKNLIDSDPQVSATRSGTVINVESDNVNYVFWIRVNVGNTSGSVAHIDESKIHVTGGESVAGILTITGTPTLGITTTTTYTLEIKTNSDRADTVTRTTLLTFTPTQYIDALNPVDLVKEYCDGSSISSVTFVLGGSSKGYEVVWIPSVPNGISLTPAASNNLSGQQTLTLMGTLDTGVTTTTQYSYFITTVGTSCSTDTISGTITVLPKQYITLTGGQANQEICNINDPITPIEYTLSGGAVTYNVSWSGGPIGLNVINTSSKTLTISGTVNVPGITTTTSYTYTITTIGNGCETDTVSGVITIIPQLDYRIDTIATRNQTGSFALCNQESIKDIVFSVIGGEQAAQVSLTWTTNNVLDNVTVTPNATNTTWTIAGIVNETVTSLTSYPYQITIYRPGTCADPVSFTGIIQVAPNPQVDASFIQENDVTDVSCEGGSDGSIVIPITPESEFIKRITGGKLAAQQLDAVTVSASSTLAAGDVVRLKIDGFTFEATVGAGQATSTVLQSLADQINFGVNASNVNVSASVISTTTPPQLRISADTAGVPFATSSVTVISATNTITTIITQIIQNETLNYAYDWYDNNGVLIGNGPSISNLEAGTYYLEVSINGCSTSPYEFTIEEPKTTIGNVVESCEGSITIPISAYLTPTQLNKLGNTIRVELFERAANNAYTISYGFEAFNAVTASNTWIVQFDGLTSGETYQLVATDNTCAQRTTLIIGPIAEEITINEALITIIDEECAGDGGALKVNNNAISGGSGFFTYEWTGAGNYNTQNVVGANPGLYTLQVTDRILGCIVTTVGDIEVIASEGLDVRPSNSLILTNDCVDGREGLLEVVVTGGDGANYSYEWEFTPASTSTTIVINKNTPQFIPNIDLPAGLSSSGHYTVYVYDGLKGDGCSPTPYVFDITGPTPIEFVAVSSTNVKCLEGDDGTLTFEVSGGIPPYKYSLTGGVPDTNVTAQVMVIQNLTAGTYNLVVGDSSSAACNPTNRVTQQVVIKQPNGAPLELSEDEVIGIPCSGGTGSIRIGITGGATISSTTNFQVSVVGPDGYRRNDTVGVSAATYLLENLSVSGKYTITITDALINICNPTSIEIQLDQIPTNLSATATSSSTDGCNSPDSTGGTISITDFDKGDGNIGDYPHWQRRTSIELYRFTLSLNGSAVGVDPTQIGVTIDGVAFDASGMVSITSIQDLAANLAIKIDSTPNYSARLNGSQVIVSGQIIDQVSSNTVSNSKVNLTISTVASYQESRWVDLPELAGLEKIENLQAGVYRGIIRDGSGCGSTLVKNSAGGSTFRIDDPQLLKIDNVSIDNVTCNNDTATIRFQLTNGLFVLKPDKNMYALKLNSSKGTFTVSPSIDVNANRYYLDSLIPDDYELTVENIQTSCIDVYTFTILPPAEISYNGDTDFTIDPCYDTYQEIFFIHENIKADAPFFNLDGEPYFSLVWKFYPEDTTRGVKTINTLSNNVNFKPEAGVYQLFIRDANGCTLFDESGDETFIEFTFTKELNRLVVNGTGGVLGNEMSQPVSCEIDAADGQINIEIVSQEQNGTVPPLNISWEVQATNNIAFEQKLRIEGVQTGTSSEVYTILLNDNVVTYTALPNESKTSVFQELIKRINLTNLYTAVEKNNEIVITSISQSALELEIVSRGRSLELIKITSNVASWIPLDGTNGYPNYDGYLDLDNLAEGLYRYTITSVSQEACENVADSYSLRGVIAVENENILEIREGPVVDEYLCNGQPGTLFVDVFDGNTGPLTFFYNGLPVTYQIVGTDQYLINIDDPVESASLEIYNAFNCGLSREINIGNGIPLFDFTSTNFEQAGTFLSREDITFYDLSENQYDSFEFNFGDGNQTERLERNSPEPILHEYAISGTYFVKLRIYNDLGCMKELSKPIKIGKGYNILVPNVFTPNGDIWNNTFRPIFNGLSEIYLRIYDAQGSLLYEELGEVDKDPDIEGVSLLGWDGSNQISTSPYFIYVISGKTIDNQEVFRDGTFIILR